MKQILLVLALFGILNQAELKANELELGVNLLTFHVYDRNEGFANKVDEKGAFMTNKVNYIRYNQYYLIEGVDSIGSQMHGMMYETNNNILIGGYTYNKREWNTHLGYTGKNKYKNDLGEALGFIPVLGYKINKEHRINKQLKLNFNLIISPVICNATVGLIIEL